MCLCTHTQTKCKDAKHYLSGSCWIPSMTLAEELEDTEFRTPDGPRGNDPDLRDPDNPDGDDGDDNNASDPSVKDNPILALTHALTLLSHTTRCRPKDSGAVHTKVGFALSFLKGITLAWFEPDLLNVIPGTEPAWANNYSEFVIELTTNFGPHDPVSDAEHQLNNLSMKDSSQINKYIIEFNHLTTQVCGYGEGALCHMFYNGLPDHIKDKITHIGKPPGLINLHTMAQGIDACYWEHKSEIACQTKTNPQPSSLSKQSLSGGSSSRQSGNSSGTSSSSSTSKGKSPQCPSSSTPKSSDSSTPDLSDII
ncbi:hypothetical protein ID866_12432, partial [Astraeus odoratus]